MNKAFFRVSKELWLEDKYVDIRQKIIAEFKIYRIEYDAFKRAFKVLVGHSGFKEVEEGMSWPEIMVEFNDGDLKWEYYGIR
jgi:hypothetical protein